MGCTACSHHSGCSWWTLCLPPVASLTTAPASWRTSPAQGGTRHRTQALCRPLNCVQMSTCVIRLPGGCNDRGCKHEQMCVCVCVSIRASFSLCHPATLCVYATVFIARVVGGHGGFFRLRMTTGMGHTINVVLAHLVSVNFTDTAQFQVLPVLGARCLPCSPWLVQLVKRSHI